MKSRHSKNRTGVRLQPIEDCKLISIKSVKINRRFETEMGYSGHQNKGLKPERSLVSYA